MLQEQVRDLLNNQSLAGYFVGQKKVDGKGVKKLILCNVLHCHGMMRQLVLTELFSHLFLPDIIERNSL